MDRSDVEQEPGRRQFPQRDLLELRLVVRDQVADVEAREIQLGGRLDERRVTHRVTIKHEYRGARRADRLEQARRVDRCMDPGRAGEARIAATPELLFEISPRLEGPDEVDPTHRQP